MRWEIEQEQEQGSGFTAFQVVVQGLHKLDIG